MKQSHIAINQREDQYVILYSTKLSASIKNESNFIINTKRLYLQAKCRVKKLRVHSRAPSSDHRPSTGNSFAGLMVWIQKLGT